MSLECQSPMTLIEAQITHMKKAKSSMMCFRNLPLPPMLINRAKPTWATMAPSLPEAAQIPWAVDRYRVGKASPGMTER